jgi:hypothetical protein
MWNARKCRRNRGGHITQYTKPQSHVDDMDEVMPASFDH